MRPRALLIPEAAYLAFLSGDVRVPFRTAASPATLGAMTTVAERRRIFALIVGPALLVSHITRNIKIRQFLTPINLKGLKLTFFISK